MSNLSEILPCKFGSLTIQLISWQDFPGEVDNSMPWSAHIYWFIDYKIIDLQKKKVTAKLNMSKRSWVRPQKKCDHLLNHQQGHYLIGSICVLEFLRRIDKKKNTSNQRFQDLVQQTFDRTIKEFLQLEKRYDIETCHRLNLKKQQQWNVFIYQKLMYYKQIYDSKKNRFVNYSQSPSKNRKN